MPGRVDMAMAMIVRVSLFLFFFFANIYGASAANFWIKNQCAQTVWPAGLPGGGTELRFGETWVVNVSPGSSGRFWGRTGCDFDIDGSTRGSCQTGDCGQVLHCSLSGKGPSTLVEFTLGRPEAPGAVDFYDVSLVDGFNLPVGLLPSNRTCRPAGCYRDLNAVCPVELKVKGGCQSACAAFDRDDFCCRNAYAQDCLPNAYSRFFKSECPSAYSFAKDDQTSLFTCPSGTDYTLLFCP